MWRSLIDDVKNADDIEKIVDNYIKDKVQREGIEAINKLRNIVDEDEIPEDKKCEIIEILIKNVDREMKKEINKEKIIDLINISRQKDSVSKF